MSFPFQSRHDEEAQIWSGYDCSKRTLTHHERTNRLKIQTQQSDALDILDATYPPKVAKVNLDRLDESSGDRV